MQEVKKFKPVRVKATTKESAVEQALQMTGASIEEVEVEVLEETSNGVTVRVAPLTAADAAPEPASEPAEEAAPNEESAAPAETIPDETTPAAAEDSNFSNTSSLASSQAQDRAREAAQDLLERMGLDAVAKLGEMPGGVGPLASSHPTEIDIPGELAGGSGLPRTFLNIEGEDVGILIGKHGQTLRAFQYLLNLSLNNSGNTEGVYVMVDAGDYRSRRATVLEKATQNAIERARRERRAVRLEPMPAHERRLVHLILQAEKDLTTTSEGREPWRRVVVAPQGVRISRSGGSSRRPRSNGNGGRHHQRIGG